jgi:tetratricopeptide (TPR) repeat protein/ferredoxin
MASPLRVIQPAPKVRHSRMSKRRAAVLLAVHVVIAAHIAHWLVAGRTVTPVEPSEAMAFAKGGMVNAGLVFFAATILLTAVFGRFFCGWACHLVALQDLCRWLLEKLGHRPQPLRSRLLKFVPAIAFFYMFLWPVVYRLWIRDSFGDVGTEWTTTEFWSTFPGWIVGAATFLVCGFAAVYFLGAKGFCTYACPYGAVFGAAERLASFRIRVTDACQHCGHCTSVCTSNVRVHEEVATWGMVVDPGCMKCMDCVSVCPNDALYYGAGPLPLAAKARTEVPERRYPLTWSEEALVAVAFALAFFTFRGLYGAVPFLMALGLAGVVSYLMLLTARLLARPASAAKGVRLKVGGRLLPAGWAFLAAIAVLGLVWVHSAVVQVHAALGGRAYAGTAELRAAALDPTKPRRSLTGAERQRVEQAVAHLDLLQRWALLPTPGNAARLAWLHWLAGSDAAFTAAAERAIERGEAPSDLNQLLGRDAWARRDTAAAVAAYERAIAAAPRSNGAYGALGLVLAQSGDPAGAAAAFERGLAVAPRSVELAYDAGLARALAGEPEAAILHLERALALDPEHQPARENLAGVLASVGRYEDAVEHFRRSLATHPDDAATRLLLARALAAAGRREEALLEVEWSLRLAPGTEAAILLRRELESPGGE